MLIGIIVVGLIASFAFGDRCVIEGANWDVQPSPFCVGLEFENTLSENRHIYTTIFNVTILNIILHFKSQK